MSTGVLHKFYNSKAWNDFRQQYIINHFCICEVCGKPNSNTVHHIRYLTPDNYTDPSISLSESNVINVCRSCHDLIHERYQSQRREITYDSNGNVVSVKEPEELSIEKKLLLAHYDTVVSNKQDAARYKR